MTTRDWRATPCYCGTLRKATRAVTRLYDCEMEDSGLRITQYSLLSWLRFLGPVSMKTLADKVRLERTTLLRNLQLLAARNLVEISPAGSAKAHVVRLTPEGEAARQKAVAFWQRAQARVEESLTREEHALLSKVLRKLEAL